MKSQKAAMPTDQLRLLRQVLEDSSSRCTVDFSARDWIEIQARTEHEGLSFLTITLPQFCTDFERSLDQGGVDSTRFAGWARVGTRRKQGAIPKFLSGMLSLVFDTRTGRLYEIPPHAKDIRTVVDSVRQICRTFAKVKMSCTPERDAAAIGNFVQTEQDLRSYKPSQSQTERFESVAALLWDDVLRGFNHDELLPSHGPGTTAERITGNQKYVWRTWSARAEQYFPIGGWAYPVGINPLEDPPPKELIDLRVVDSEQESPSRVMLVPKTLKSPRVIASEPVQNMYLQQALCLWLVPRIERGRYSGGQVNFTDQTVNQSMALTSSKTGEYATLDLSEASDRVPVTTAIRMFRSNPLLARMILACRSKKTLLPNGQMLRPLRKFASMGNALCFPIESMYFYTICVLTLLEEQKLPVTRKAISKVAKQVFIYGDDIIVPSRYAEVVAGNLQAFACKVNTRKSFWTGRFRESCGMDAFMGTRVNPVYVRELHPSNQRQADRIVSWVATANLFESKGYWRTAEHMYNVVERVIGKLPYLPPNHPGLGRYTTYYWLYPCGRINKRYQSREIRVWVPEAVGRTDPLRGFAALSASLINLGHRKSKENSRLPTILIERDLEYTVRRGSVALKRRWVWKD